MLVRFYPEKIDPELPGILLLSHGPLALGMLDSAEMIYGEIDNIAAFGLEPDDIVEEYCQAVVDAYKQFPANTLVFLDIYGGTPSNQIMRYCAKNSMPILAVAGMNLPLVVSAAFGRDLENGEEALYSLIEEAKESVTNVTEKLKPMM